jgi:hypothetical protein
MEDAKGAMTTEASKMFTFYSNLSSPESKYWWNKIVSKQTESDLFVNLQSVTHEDPRVMFHLLTVFPTNTAEQEKYYITNVLNKPSASTYVSLYVM